MIVSSIWRIALLIVALLFTGCSPILHIYLPQEDEPQKTFTTIFQESLTQLTGIPAYSPSMRHSDDSFLITALPGIPLVESDLAFSSLSGSRLTGDIIAVDQAYRFAKLVNQVVISGTTYEKTGIQLGNLYPCLLNLIPPEKMSATGFNDLKLIKLSSATYNDDFYLTTVTPAVNNLKAWADYDKIFKRKIVVLNKENKSLLLSGTISSHRFKASLVRLDLSRHSMLDQLIKYSRAAGKKKNRCLPKMKRPLAVITGLILAKDIEVVKYATSNVPVILNSGTNGNSIKPAEPAASMSSEGPLIIGIIGSTFTLGK